MKNSFWNMIIIIFCIVFFIEIIINNGMVYSTISTSLNIWTSTLIPSLFPFFIISDILIDYNIISYIPKKIKVFLCKVFNISDSALVILILSMISGFPSNARNTRTMYDKKMISRDEASYILMFTHFSNPLFILTTVGLIFLNNNRLGFIILIAHFFSNIILGILLRNNNIPTSNNYIFNDNNKHLGIILTNSIKHAIDTLLLIFGTLTVFLVISSILINRFDFDVYSSAILKGILEITIGLRDLSFLKISDIYKVVISTMFISFGGFSVHMQVISQLVGTDISYKNFFQGRIYQSIISGILAYFLYYIIIL